MLLKKLWLVYFILFMLDSAFAADITAKLDSDDGSSAFSIRDSGNSAVAKLRSNGSLWISGTIEISGAGTSLCIGNLGIGTDSPMEKLVLTGGIRISGSAGTQEGTIRFTGTDFEGRAGNEWLTLTEDCDFKNNGNNSSADRSLGNTDNYDLGFITNNSVRLHIENSGNIGIGTAAPGASLEINGNMAVSKDIVIREGLRLDSGGVSCTTSEMLIVDGNMGVGITDPSEKLCVNGTIEATAFIGDGSQLTDVPQDFPDQASLWFDESTVLVGGDLDAVPDTDQLFCTYSYLLSFTTGNGDTISQNFFLKAGTYSFSVLGLADNVSGKIDWYIDDVLKVSGQDWYSAATVYNVIKTNSVTITGDGVHTLKGVINGKNASSSGYAFILTRIWFLK